MDFLTALLVDGHKRGRLRYRGAGLLVKKGSYRALVGDIARNKYYYDPKNRSEQFYNLGNEQYTYPARFGAWTDAGVSSKVGNLLENNEQSIKKYVRGNDEN